MQAFFPQSVITPLIHHESSDRRLRQLAIIWNPEKFRLLVASTLATSFTQHEATHCKILRYRYRPERRSIVLYELTLRHSITHKETLCWLTGTVHSDPGRMHKLYRKTRKLFKPVKQEATTNGLSPLPAVFFLPEVDMLVQQYPFDRYLPGLCEFFQRFACTPQRQAIEQPSRLVPHRYRPFLSATVERCPHGDKKPSEFYKFYRPESAAENYSFLKRLYNQNQGKSESFRLLAPVRFEKMLSAVVFQHAGGQSIDTLLAIPGTNLQLLAQSSASALLAFHSHGVVPDKVRTIADTRARAKRALAFIQCSDKRYSEKIQSVLSSVEHLFSQRVKSGATHLDIKPDHLLVGSQVTLIDLDSSALSDPVADIAMMAVRILAAKEDSQLPAACCDKFLREFLDSYFVQAPSNCRQTFPLYLRLSWLKVCLFYVQHALPDWQRRTRTLLSQTMEIERSYSIGPT